jgi:hypothetical protein
MGEQTRKRKGQKEPDRQVINREVFWWPKEERREDGRSQHRQGNQGLPAIHGNKKRRKQQGSQEHVRGEAEVEKETVGRNECADYPRTSQQTDPKSVRKKKKKNRTETKKRQTGSRARGKKNRTETKKRQTGSRARPTAVAIASEPAGNSSVSA